MNTIKLDKKKIGKGYKPYIIAEMSGNHNQSLEKALEIVAAAAATGADALKIQTYTPDTMTLNIKENEFFINDKKSLWYGKSLYELYEIAHTPWDWHKPIMDKCKELGITFFSTPFDSSSVDFLEELGVPFYKIASFENCDLPLIKKVASTGKPIIISTGMANISELDETVRILRSEGCENFILLKCTSTYPADPINSNIKTIQHMRNLFNCNIGLSDHTMGIGASVASVAFGSAVIEKHFTLDRSEGGVDSTFSLEPREMTQLVIESKRAWQSLGEITYGSSDAETGSKVFRRSIYISEDIKEGDFFSEENIRIIRPGYGLPPKYFDVVLGKRCLVSSKKGEPLTWKHI